LPVAVAEGLPHAALGFAVLVVPAVVHERDATVDRAADDADAFRRILGAADVVAAEADGGDLLTRATERAVDHVLRHRPRGRGR